MVHNMLLNTDA